MRLLQQGSSADGHHGFSGSHLGIDHGRRLLMIHQQLDERLHCFCLGRKWLALECIESGLAALVARLALLDGRIENRRVLRLDL